MKVMMDARALRRKDAKGGGNAIEDRVTRWNQPHLSCEHEKTQALCTSKAGEIEGGGKNPGTQYVRNWFKIPAVSEIAPISNKKFKNSS